jgi:adenosylhomocysteine nucleosidase
MSRIAIIAALPREVAALVRGVKGDPALAAKKIYLYELPHAVVVAAGMGRERVTLAVQAAIERGAIAELISVGLAGACSPEVGAGQVIEVGEVVDVRTGERFRTAGDGATIVVSTDSIASVAEKARLHAAYRASAVDMEAATVARLAQAHGIPFRAIKAISDGYDFELETLAQFSDARGQFRTTAFALHTALRPGSWAKTMALGGNSKRALMALHERLGQILGSSR